MKHSTKLTQIEHNCFLFCFVFKRKYETHCLRTLEKANGGAIFAAKVAKRDGAKSPDSFKGDIIRGENDNCRRRPDAKSRAKGHSANQIFLADVD